VLRIYLTIRLLGGADAAAGGASTDAMIRRLGPRWQQLHNFVYLIGVLAWCTTSCSRSSTSGADDHGRLLPLADGYRVLGGGRERGGLEVGLLGIAVAVLTRWEKPDILGTAWRRSPRVLPANLC